FSARNTVARSALDAIGTGTGFMIAMLLMSGVRELLGSGTLLGVPVMGDSFEPWIIMILPPGGFFTLGILLLLLSWRSQKGVRRPQPRRWPHQAVVRTAAQMPVVAGGER
ncbi:MAG: hypothetical protein KFH98_09720, partial [Gemmatimonadetes bacterium]|nr:hypothetical protein [Gemmatimonadota bacterium]